MNRAFMGRSLAAALAAGALFMPACSSDPEHAGMVQSSGGATAQGGAASSSGGRGGAATAEGGDSGVATGGSMSGAGQPGTGGEDSGGAESGGTAGNSGDGGSDLGGGGGGGAAADPYRCPSDDAAPPSPALLSQCSPVTTWGKGVPVPIDAGDGDQLIGVTPDELTIVWFDARGAAGTYKIADRSASNEDFATPTALDAGSVIGVSPDGLRLTSLSFDQSALVEYVRSARGEAFGAGDEGAFAALNADALAQGYRVLDALIAPDDETLYYNVSANEELEFSLHVSQRSGGESWPVGVPIEACELKAFGTLVRHPTGASADGLTLFFYDPTRGGSRAAFRRTVSDPFVWFADLGPRYQVAPNQSCDKLYYTASDERSTLFVAPAE